MEMKQAVLARFAGVFLLASGLFLLAALVTWGTFGHQTPLGFAFLAGGIFCGLGWILNRSKTEAARQTSRPRDVSRRGRTLLAVNAFASTLLLGVILIGLNYLAARRHWTLDLTPNRANSLSDQTLKTLKRLPGPVRFTYFYATAQSDPNVQSLLSAYARASDQVRFESVSALREPSRVPAGFNGAPLVVARLDKTGASPQEVSVADEANLTSALLKILDPRAQTLYFLQGHGEIVPAQLQELQIALEAQNYSLKTLSLQLKTAKIPADCAALVVMAPQVDCSAPEAKILTDYAGSKGRLLFFAAPARAILPRFGRLLGSLGLDWRPGSVFDNAYRNPQWPVGVRGDVARQPILRGVSGDCIFPGSAPLQSRPQAPGLTPIFSSSAQSRAVFPEGQSLGNGPFVLAAASERGENRALICATPNVAVGEGLRLFGNKSFVLSGFNWVVGNAALVSIPAKTPGQNTLQMPDVTARFAALFCVLVLPLLALGTGAVVWWKRR